jgi:hypothetical protein
MRRERNGKPPAPPGELNWSQKAEEFHARMDQAKFTMDFNSSLEAIMADRTASNRERVLAWIKRYAALGSRPV